MTKQSDNLFSERLLHTVNKYSSLGKVIHPNGTISIGKIPNRKQWFLFHLYSGLELNNILTIESEIGKIFPSSLKNFYMKFNGVSMFGAGQLSLWGLRGIAPKDMPNYQPVPFSTSHLDVILNIPNSPDDIIFFGTYFGCYKFYVRQGSDVVSVCKKPDFTPLEQWDNIEMMILDVTKRLSVWFDSNAQPIDQIVNEKPVLFENDKN